jgi:hypothetical protein
MGFVHLDDIFVMLGSLPAGPAAATESRGRRHDHAYSAEI